ncbi:MAG: serine O-acetyltransferase [Candidatus Omnitrophica bacterium]|nr:serine O-acetyltransferase [Candidatus Omnitrophota bacterium]
MSILFYVLLAFILIIIAKAAVISLVFKEEIRSARERDPAARSNLEVILLYEGLHAVIAYRAARFFYKIRFFFIARLISVVARHFTGIEIHPGAKIGKGLFIDHGMGVVIGETSILGDNITLYQGVTLGGTGKEKGKRHPTLGNNVVIGAGAKVLGNIAVGDNSYVGANAVVIKDVPPNSTVVGVPGRVTKQDGKRMDFDLDHIHVIDPIMQNIEELEERVKKLEQDKH